MKLDVKSDYACRAVEWLAFKYSTGLPSSIGEMARRQRIPANYLVQILRELKGRGLIRSLRGRVGGYVLARSPEKITFADVLRALHGDVFDISCAKDRDCPDELKRVWSRLKAALEHEAAAVTFDDITRGMNGRAQMFYI